MIYSISPWKAAKGHIMPGLCQVNNTWLEPTYYIYPCTVHTPNMKNDDEKMASTKKVYFIMIFY